MKNILVTGISSGIGFSVADQLLASGVSVIGLDRSFSENITHLQQTYPEALTFHLCDLLDVDTLPSLIRTLVANHGPLGGLVHCAGYDKMMPLHLAKATDIENLWRIHALAPMVLIASLSKRNHYQDQCSIVLISSQSAHEGAMGHTAYASAKGAVEGYLAPAAAELMQKGIRLNVVCFAPIRTPMASAWLDKLSDEAMKKLLESYPLGLGEVSDASNLICFLLSEKSRFINGQIITADGGHSVRKI